MPLVRLFEVSGCKGFFPIEIQAHNFYPNPHSILFMKHEETLRRTGERVHCTMRNDYF